MKYKRTPIGKFIHSSWININLRAANGKYRKNNTNLQNHKNKVYENIYIVFTREEYKKWCLANKDHILSLKRPSIDRIEHLKNYSLDNIQVIELEDNIRKKRKGNTYLNGPRSNTKRGIRKHHNRWTVRITINKKEIHLGSFKTEQEALDCFYNTYLNHYKKSPWC